MLEKIKIWDSKRQEWVKLEKIDYQQKDEIRRKISREIESACRKQIAKLTERRKNA